ncbi:hypothetical protein [Chryseobacterium sp. Leaf201]|uniref:hypothetical protein n=1 Tax=Chryseobacterium sp. Leaf201 TaxID=1735672 RepID=UPI0006F5D680|nr:hypothetical protein [Chryseobacterium sp. Leaf201]KQM37787.1 hypothetical protein ASE55_14510 [Chryseobacterium sp. Leaf201]
MIKNDLKKCVVKALENNNRKAKIVDICRFIWINYENELCKSGDLFYTWQYDVRWAGTKLRKDGIMKSAEEQVNGYWELTDT